MNLTLDFILFTLRAASLEARKGKGKAKSGWIGLRIGISFRGYSLSQTQKSTTKVNPYPAINLSREGIQQGIPMSLCSYLVPPSTLPLRLDKISLSH